MRGISLKKARHDGELFFWVWFSGLLQYLVAML